MTKRSSTWDASLAAFRPEITAQGEVTYAYNRLQESFFNLFYLALGLERPDQYAMQPNFYSYVLTIWHVLPSDRLQRELALAALAKLPTTLEIRGGIERLEWARRKADKLADYRNLIVHTPVTYWPRPSKGESIKLVPGMGGISTKPVHRERLARIKSLRFWKSLRNDLLNLNDYVEFVQRQIWGREYERHNGPVVGAARTWPRKPRLPCIRRIASIERELAKAMQPPRGNRRRRRRTSADSAKQTKRQ